MRILHRVLLTVACLGVLTAAGRSADIPRMINYQAVISDDQGNPINQNGLAFEFSIHDAAAVGALLWQEGPVVKDVTDGLLSHPLGSSVALPDSLFARYAELWLQISVDGESLPRVQLLSSGYAFRVSTVDSASGGTITGEVKILGAAPGWQLDVYNELGGGGAGNFHTFDAASSTPALRAQTNGTGPAMLSLHDLGGDALKTAGGIVVGDVVFNDKIRLEPTSGLSGGGRVALYSNDGDTTVTIEGDYFGRGRVLVNDTTGNAGVEIDGLAAKVTVSDPQASGQSAINLFGKGVFSSGSLITMTEGDGDATITLDADPAGNNGSRIIMREASADRIVLEAYEGSLGGSRITLYDGASNPTVILDSDNAGDGRVTTEVLEITGGADLSEQFEISSETSRGIEPGMVLAIDPERAGYLRISDAAYDRSVAGIVSGAGGVKTGLLMGQSQSVADGKYAVALTGRVWCKADASHGRILPGDMLTTSTTPGHAMKAVDASRMHGAIIGKAMSALECGTGLVLVLVSLQ